MLRTSFVHTSSSLSFEFYAAACIWLFRDKTSAAHYNLLSIISQGDRRLRKEGYTSKIDNCLDNQTIIFAISLVFGLFEILPLTLPPRMILQTLASLKFHLSVENNFCTFSFFLGTPTLLRTIRQFLERKNSSFRRIKSRDEYQMGSRLT